MVIRRPGLGADTVTNPTTGAIYDGTGALIGYTTPGSTSGDPLSTTPLTGPQPVLTYGPTLSQLTSGASADQLAALLNATATPGDTGAASRIPFVPASSSTLTDWLNANSTYVVVAAVAVFALMLFSGGGRRR
jgi:hypothetical protein